MNKAEIEGIFREHAPAVHGMVYRLTLDGAAADDATQEAFVRLLTKPPKDESNLVAWLKRVAVNFAIDQLRRQTAERGHSDFLAGASAEKSECPRPETEEDGISELTAAIKRLNPDHRAALLAIDRDGMSYVEAARLLGIAQPKLKSDLIRARRALLEMVKGAKT